MDKNNNERYRDATVALFCAINIKRDLKSLSDWLESNKGLASEFDKAREMIGGILWDLSVIKETVDKWENR